MKNLIYTVHYMPRQPSAISRIICAVVYLICAATAVYISGDSWMMSLITGAAFLMILFSILKSWMGKHENVFKTKQDLLDWANGVNEK